jgi:predicted signal transduction protein with EAL and GGDEF domain
VTAEGVETAAELSALADLGCDLLQGFLVAKPMDVAEFGRWRLAWPSRAMAQKLRPLDASARSAHGTDFLELLRSGPLRS